MRDPANSVGVLVVLLNDFVVQSVEGDPAASSDLGAHPQSLGALTAAVLIEPVPP